MNHLILIGFMGSGKTTVGKKLSESLHIPFVDTDEEIEKASGMKIADIFSRYGEPYFRDLETQEIRRLSEDAQRKVISAGGGLAAQERNRPYLKQMGTVVFLQARTESLIERLAGDTERPMLKGADLRERIETLMEQRREAYERAADLSVWTDEKNIEEIVEEIKNGI